MATAHAHDVDADGQSISAVSNLSEPRGSPYSGALTRCEREREKKKTLTDGRPR
jgi:hypothetical protein